MAAAIIPIAASIVPIVLPWIAKLMDKIHGANTGPTKYADGTALAETVFSALQKQLAGMGISLPTSAAELGPLLQKTVDDLNKAGVLKGHDTVVDAPAGTASPTADPRAFFMEMAELMSDTATKFINAAKTAPK